MFLFFTKIIIFQTRKFLKHKCFCFNHGTHKKHGNFKNASVYYMVIAYARNWNKILNKIYKKLIFRILYKFFESIFLKFPPMRRTHKNVETCHGASLQNSHFQYFALQAQALRPYMHYCFFSNSSTSFSNFSTFASSSSFFFCWVATVVSNASFSAFSSFTASMRSGVMLP